MGVGLMGSIFGGGAQTPGYVQQLYDNQNALFNKAMNLYNSTNLQNVDQQAMNAYTQGTQALANQYLNNYNAGAGGAGSEAWKSDTTKDRANAQIAGDMASKAAMYNANLIESRPERQMGLLPNMYQTSAMTGPAEYLQNQQLGQNQQTLGGLMALSRMFTPQRSQNSDMQYDPYQYSQSAGPTNPYGIVGSMGAWG